MRGWWVVCLAVGAASAWEFDVGAGEVAVDGQFRSQVLARNNGDFNGGRDDDRTQLLTRTRFGATWHPSDDWSVRVLAQDSRSWDPYSPKSIQDELELYEAYVAADLGRWSIVGGRQPLTFGSRRLIGTGEWSNVARRFDALRGTWHGSGATVDVFAATLGSSALTKGMKGEFYGVWSRLDDLAGAPTQLYGLYNYQSLPGAPSVFTVGVLREMTLGPVQLQLEAAGQFGDVLAYMAVADATVPVCGLTLQGILSVASGDGSGGANGGRGTFRNLYPDNHGRYGCLDYMSLQNVIMLESKLTAPLADGCSVSAWYNSFWLYDEADAWYGANCLCRGNGVGDFRDPTGSSGRHIGQELDLMLNLRLGGNVTMQVGYGRFFAGEFISRVNAAAGAGTVDSDFFWWETYLNF